MRALLALTLAVGVWLASLRVDAASHSPFARSLQQVTSDDLACYGNYCGRQSSCAGRSLDPAVRDPPIDRLDSVCFLHDVCYTCSTGAAGDTCCPDPALRGIDKAECDRVFLHRLRNDNVCDGSPVEQATDSTLAALLGREGTAAELAGCTATKEAAIQLFEGILAGREFGNDLTGSGTTSATNNVNATCTAFACPYTSGSSCFQPCGADECGANCGGGAGTCPSGLTCDAYSHACFRPNGNTDNDDDDGIIDNIRDEIAAAHTLTQRSVAQVAGLLLLGALAAITMV